MDFSFIQSWDLGLVEWIQSFRSSWLDGFFLLITELGDETVFLVLAAVLYWLVDKRYAYRLMMFFLYSAVLNASLKLTFNRPRPHTLPSVDSVGEPSIGTSFPSGHAMNSTTTAWVLHERNKPYQSWITGTLVGLVFLVLLSRLYLGQHYLTDVIVGTITASIFYGLITFLIPYIQPHGKRIIAISLPLLFLSLFFIHDEVLTIAASAIIFVNIGIYFEQRFIRFNMKASPLGLFLRFTVGIIGALVFKEGLKIVFPYSDQLDPTTMDLWLDFIRYGLICVWMAVGAPSLFKYLK
jgi:undecaprenyl-diphosphatase